MWQSIISHLQIFNDVAFDKLIKSYIYISSYLYKVKIQVYTKIFKQNCVNRSPIRVLDRCVLFL